MIIRFESMFNFEDTQRVRILDRENGIIKDVCAMHEGEALGHGIAADNGTLHIMARLGNLAPKGIRGRFGHPGMSENATGKQVQIAHNFSVQDDKLLHTSQLLSSARKSPVFTQDPVEFILDLAENNPTHFGESVVINCDLVWVLADDSERPLNDEELDRVGYGLESPEDAINPLPVMRPSEFHYVDFVNEGALTHNGLFSTDSDSVMGFNSIFAPGKSPYFAKEIFEFLDQWRKAYKVNLEQLSEIAPKKVNQLLAAYVAYRTKESNLIMSEKNTTEEIKVEDVNPVELAFQDDGGQDPMLADLAETQAIMTELETGFSEDEESDRDVILTAIGGLQTDMVQLQETFTGQIEGMRVYISELSKAVVGQARLLQTLDKKLKTLSGERVLTHAVARSPQTALEDLSQSAAFSFEAQPGPQPHEADSLLGNGPTTPAKVRGRDLSVIAWENRQKVDSGQ